MRSLKRASMVVVIDEDAHERASAESLLVGQGFRVRSTGDANDGVDCVRSSGADVVVLGFAKSWQMLDLVRRLRGRFEPIPLPVQPRIVIAARELDGATERFARRLGADAVLRRPISEREWLAEVSRLARHERPAPAPVHQAG